MGLIDVQDSSPPPQERPAAPPPAADEAGTPAPPPAGTPAGTGVLRQPGEAPRDVPLMSIRKDDAVGERVQVGPVTPGIGVPDVLMGSIGIVAVAVIGALILGVVLGGLLVLVKHRLGWGGPETDAEQHVSLDVDRR